MLILKWFERQKITISKNLEARVQFRHLPTADLLRLGLGLQLGLGLGLN